MASHYVKACLVFRIDLLALNDTLLSLIFPLYLEDTYNCPPLHYERH